MYTEKRDFGGVDTSNVIAGNDGLFADEVVAPTAPIATANDIKPVLQTSQTEQSAPTETTKRTPPKQRMNEYRERYLTIPKIVDRKPVFISLTLRDEIDEITRKFGGRGMSTSGFIENLVRHHLEEYRADLERWRKI
ncbi:MAG: DUF3408 domain-containing protein [Rikenellaceae bacterium]